MTQRSDSLAQRSPEDGAEKHVSAASALGAVAHAAAQAATGRARSTPARSATAAFSPGSDPVRSAVPVKLVWHDPVTGEELTLKLEACRELIDGLKMEGFEATESEEEGGDSAAA